MKHSFAPRRAFTLIEILVVIAIIGILSAILFPVLSRARENGRKTVCLSNMKQLGLAFLQYTQDSAGKYPLAADFLSWGPGKAAWVSGTDNVALASSVPPFVITPDLAANNNQAKPENGALFPYIKNAEPYICPSDKDGKEKRLTYSMNCGVGALSVSRIRSPGDIVLLVDEEGANDGYFFAVKDDSAQSEVGGAATDSTDALTKRHNGGGNLLFTDGHAKFYPFDTFPLDGTLEGKKNKWKTAGSPRFHDRSFGPFGSAMRTGATTVDECNAKAGPGNADGSGNISTATVTP